METESPPPEDPVESLYDVLSAQLEEERDAASESSIHESTWRVIKALRETGFLPEDVPGGASPPPEDPVERVTAVLKSVHFYAEKPERAVAEYIVADLEAVGLLSSPDKPEGQRGVLLGEEEAKVVLFELDAEDGEHRPIESWDTYMKAYRSAVAKLRSGGGSR